MYITRYSCHILTKDEPSLQIFNKYFNIKFHENSSSEGRGVQCGQTQGTMHSQAGQSQYSLFAFLRTDLKIVPFPSTVSIFVTARISLQRWKLKIINPMTISSDRNTIIVRSLVAKL